MWIALWMMKPALFAVYCLRPYGLSVDVDFHQIGSSDLVEAQAVRIDQEVVLGTRHARADVGVDQLGPAEVVGDAVRGGELHRAVGPTSARQRLRC